MSSKPDSSTGRRISECDLEIRASDSGGYLVTIRLVDNPRAPRVLVSGAPCALDRSAFAATPDPASAGQPLAQQFFANPQIKRAWATMCAITQRPGFGLRLRLHLHDRAKDLHDLPWETLQSPDELESGLPLTKDWHIYFSRYIPSRSQVQAIPADTIDRRAVLAVASPGNLHRFQLPEIDVGWEIRHALRALGASEVHVIGEYDDARHKRVTLSNLGAELQSGAPILYLVCHCTITDQHPKVCLENERGRASWVSVDRFVQTIRRSPPLLIILAHHAGATSGEERALMLFGQQLVRSGMPAVLVTQGVMRPETIQILMRALLSELLRDGAIDRALATARGELRDSDDWWKPVLFSRLKQTYLWNTLPSQATAGAGSLRTFIDRREELFMYQKLLTFGQRTSIFALRDARGMGKSLLLQEFKRQALVRNIPVSLIDLKKSVEPSPRAVADKIYRDFSEDPFGIEFLRYENRRKPGFRPWSSSMGQHTAERASFAEARPYPDARDDEFQASYRAGERGEALPRFPMSDRPGRHAQAKAGLEEQVDLAALRRLLVARFNLEELRTLCFDLGIHHDQLAATGRDATAREVIDYVQRRKKMGLLLAECERLRPEEDWSAVLPPAIQAAGARTYGDDEDEALNVFLRDLGDACRRQPAVILIDGYEMASPALQWWLSTRLIVSLFGNGSAARTLCLLVIAGQEAPNFDIEAFSSLYPDLFFSLPGLSHWTVSDIEDCMQRYDRPMRREIVSDIHDQARRGVPIIELVSLITMPPQSL